MPRRRASVLLLAFLAAVMAGGSGGVKTPWSPGPAVDQPPPVVVAHADLVRFGSIYRFARME